jgi:hypothetical protein
MQQQQQQQQHLAAQTMSKQISRPAVAQAPQDADFTLEVCWEAASSGNA